MALNATSVGVGRRNRFFLCICSRNCIFFISGIDIVFIVVMVMYQNRQVMLTSFGFFSIVGAARRVQIARAPATSRGRW